MTSPSADDERERTQAAVPVAPVPAAEAEAPAAHGGDRARADAALTGMGGSALPVRRVWTWRSSLREFGVIVAGVLVALAAQAWWEGVQERELEQSYLRQLLADARENEERLAHAIAEDSAAVRASARVMSAFAGGPAPPADSMLHWLLMMGRGPDFQPLTGTHRALLGTGDLRLVRSDTLRSALMAYASAVDNESERLQQLRGVTLSAILPLARVLPFMRTLFERQPRPEEIDVAALLADDEAAAVLFTLQATAVNRLNGMLRLHETTRGLIDVLSSELGDDAVDRPGPD